ncbi:helix-turn-helix domain-containing protein [Paratractidigestivibacter faecalis]|uniref:helix-turn-helix domain-containing protein n=1 Tax=Paratractidigestivibacter faecalis TaxID=2292441 RepID=UPI003AB3EAD9
MLRAHREESHMTQELVAQHMGVSRQAVSKWESGATEPSTTNLMEFARLYGTTAADLLREVDG